MGWRGLREWGWELLFTLRRIWMWVEYISVARGSAIGISHPTEESKRNSLHRTRTHASKYASELQIQNPTQNAIDNQKGMANRSFERGINHSSLALHPRNRKQTTRRVEYGKYRKSHVHNSATKPPKAPNPGIRQQGCRISPIPRL